MAGVAEIVGRLPPAAVKEDDEWMRCGDGGLALSERKPEIAELRGIGAVGDAVVGGEDGEGHKVHAHGIQSGRRG